MTKQELLQQAAEEAASRALTLYSNISDAKKGLEDTLKNIESDSSLDAGFKEFSVLMTKLAIIALDDFIIIG